MALFWFLIAASCSGIGQSRDHSLQQEPSCAEESDEASFIQDASGILSRLRLTQDDSATKQLAAALEPTSASKATSANKLPAEHEITGGTVEPASLPKASTKTVVVYHWQQDTPLMLFMITMTMFLVAGFLCVLRSAHREQEEIAQALKGDQAVDQSGKKLLSSWTRKVSSEFVGTFAAQFFCRCMAWKLTYTYDFLPAHTNQLAGIATAPVQPASPLFIGVTIGVSYALIIFVCPDATLNPLMTAHGLRSVLLSRNGATVFGVICIAQLMGNIFANALAYALLITPMTHFIPVIKTMDAGPLSLFGLAYPEEWVPNSLSMLATVLCTTIFIFVLHGILSGFRRNQTLHNKGGGMSLAASCSIGALVMLVVLTLDGTGLAAAFNPTTPLAAAIFLTAAGWPSDIWSHHNGAVWISILGPFIGLALGLLIARIHDYTIMPAEQPHEATDQLGGQIDEQHEIPR